MPDSTMPALTTRHATLNDLADLLQRQQVRKVDVVAGAAAIRVIEGNLIISGAEPVVSEEGVTLADGTYRPTEICDGGIAEKLRIPVDYLRRMRAEHLELYDRNVRGWLERDHRHFMIRCLRGDNDGTGIARAFLSDSYKVIDHLDVLFAALSGIRRTGLDVQIDDCDLSHRRMYVRIAAPQIAVHAPALLAGYRSPFTGVSGADHPVVHAGIVLTNSETGHGSAAIWPRLEVQVCRNGMTIKKDAMRVTHLGARLDEGVIAWSEETKRKNLELITSQAADAVTRFLDGDYVQAKLTEIERAAATPVDDPATVVEVVAAELRFTEAQRQEILTHFIRGGDITAGGVMHAVSSAAQTIDDADIAFDMEALSLRALQVAAAA